MHCPYCDALTQFELVGEALSGRGYIWGVMRCKLPICGGSIAVRFGDFTTNAATGTVIEMYPSPQAAAAEDFPNSVKIPFREAIQSLTIGAPNAAATMARRAIQEACREQGVPAEKRNLINQIDWLFEEHTISPQLKDLAHAVREKGNLGAHGEHHVFTEVAPEDAEAVVDLAQALFEHLYVIGEKIRQLTSGHAGPEDAEI